MPPEPGSPTDWLRFARSDLEVAKGPPRPGLLLETLCFHAQQAVEKSLKALLLAHQTPFPRTHNLRILVDLLPATLGKPAEVEKAVELSDYAVTTRYPGAYEPISQEQYREALRLAEAVVAWAEAFLEEKRS